MCYRAEVKAQARIEDRFGVGNWQHATPPLQITDQASQIVRPVI